MKKTIALVLLAPVLFLARGAERDTPEIEGIYMGTVAGENLPAGVLAGIWTNGLAYAAQDTKALVAVGRVEQGAESGGRVTLKRGVFLWDATSRIGAADLGKIVYMVADNPGVVSLTPGVSSNIAGVVWGVTGGSNAWVRCGFNIRN